jgi:hypothetical protein
MIAGQIIPPSFPSLLLARVYFFDAFNWSTTKKAGSFCWFGCYSGVFD